MRSKDAAANNLCAFEWPAFIYFATLKLATFEFLYIPNTSRKLKASVNDNILILQEVNKIMLVEISESCDLFCCFLPL